MLLDGNSHCLSSLQFGFIGHNAIKSADEKSKQGEKERGLGTGRSLKSDEWAAFKQLYVSSESPKTQKEMLGLSPGGLLKNQPTR